MTILRFLSFQRKRKSNLLDAIMKIKYPSHIWIEPTTRCNTRCLTCGHYFSDFGNDMLPEVFEKIEKQVLDHVNRVDLIGYGEPLISKIFLQILNSCVKRGIKISTTTNGLLLTEDLIEKLVVSNVDLIISIDGTTPEVFNSIRPKIKFDRIIKALKMIKKYNRKYSNSDSNLFVNMVVVKRNMHQVADMVELANEFGVKRIIYFNCWADKNSEQIIASEIPTKHPELLKHNFSNVRPLAAKYGIEIFAPDFFFSSNNTCGKKTDSTSLIQTESIDKLFPHYCYLPWNYAYFNVDGHVFSCCLMGHSIGNVLKNSFDEIWNGNKYNHLRRVIHSNNPPLHCKTCNLPNGLTLGNQKFLKIFLAENFVAEYDCDGQKVHFLSKTIRVPGEDNIRKFYWCKKNIAVRIKPVPKTKLLCIHISDMHLFGRYNSGILTINNYNSVEFDNTDEHILIKIPENKETRNC